MATPKCGGIEGNVMCWAPMCLVTIVLTKIFVNS